MSRQYAGWALSLVLLSSSLGAASDWANQDKMGEYAFKQYEGFWDSWHLVTARYRKDNHEIRLTYANDVAWKTIQAGKTNFADGAIFGKIAFDTMSDPLFESSQVPKAVHRYQLMIKDSVKHADTRGWGYAIFDSKGKTLQEHPEKIVKACAACHEYAAPRGYVFLGVMDPAPYKKMKGKASLLSKEEAEKIKKYLIPFDEKPRDSFPMLAKRIPEKYKNIHVIAGGLRENLFAGTLNEIRPTLIKKVTVTKEPAVLISKDQTRWTLVYPDQNNVRCVVDKQDGIGLVVDINDPVARYSDRQNWCEPLLTSQVWGK